MSQQKQKVLSSLSYSIFRWNSYEANLLTTFEGLLDSEALSDVTLFCEGKSNLNNYFKFLLFEKSQSILVHTIIPQMQALYCVMYYVMHCMPWTGSAGIMTQLIIQFLLTYCKRTLEYFILIATAFQNVFIRNSQKETI